MRHILLTAILILTVLVSFSQDVKIKKGLVYLNDTEIFKFERKNLGNDVYIYDLESDDILISFRPLEGTFGADFIKITFPKSSKVVESRALKGWPVKNTLTKLFKRGVIQEDGKFNEEKLDEFILEYHEKITDGTIR